MTDQTFSSLLTDTVQAPRLSGTKVKTLTDLFLAALDTTHIATFFKLNRSLPAGGQARISSLYVFDALARATHREAIKGKKRQEAKRCLDGLEAVVEQWVEGMTIAAAGGGGGAWTEGKEKARKIIEIWKKSDTFPSDTIERLGQRLQSHPGGAGGNGSRSTTPPYEPGQPPPISPALPPLDPAGAAAAVKSPVSGGGGEGTASSSALPADIMKLLGLPAAGTGSPSTSTSTPPPPAGANPAGSAELAAILARLPQQPQATAPGQSPAAVNPNPLAGLNMGQLAELTKVAQQIKSPPPQASGSGSTPMAMAMPPFPPQGQQAHPPFPPQGYGAPAGPGQHHNDNDRAPMPPGTSRNYGRVKPLRNPQMGMRSPPPQQQDNGYNRRQSQQQQDNGYDRERDRDRRAPLPQDDRRGSWNRDRSRSPDRRDGGGWRDRGRADNAPPPLRGGGGAGAGGGRAPFPAQPGPGPGPVTPPGPTLETFDLAMFNPGDPGAWAILGDAWKRSRGSEPNQMELMGWMQEKMMGGAGGGMMGMGMGMGGGGWGGQQQGGWQGGY